MKFDKYKTRGAYHYQWYETEEWYRKCVDKCVEFCKGSTVDVGCGDGLVSKLIADKDYEVLGIDNNDTAMGLAYKNIQWDHFHTSTYDLNNLPKITPDQRLYGGYEYVVCLNVIEHLEKPDGVLKIFRNYIDKAAIIITDMPQENPSPYHIREYSPKELADLFSEWRVVPFQIDENFHGVEVYK